MTNFRLVTFYEAPDCWDILDADEEIEIDVQLEKYVSENINENIDSPGFIVEDFTVPENLNNGLILDICNGKSFGEWSRYTVDFHNEHYQNWIFVQKDGKYVEFNSLEKNNE